MNDFLPRGRNQGKELILDHNIDRVKELVRSSMDSPEFRASVVVTLLKGGLYEQALELSLPLVGTTHSPWFLYTRSWHYLSRGESQQAFRVLTDAYKSLDPDRTDEGDEPAGFSFNSNGQPRLTSPFSTPLAYGNGSEVQWPDNGEHLGYANAIFHEDWLALFEDINRNIREYKEVFASLTKCVERGIHHDSETVRAAVASAEFDEETNYRENYFLLLTLLSEEHLRLVADTLWRVTSDWNNPLDLCEVVCFLFYLLEEDKTAMTLAELGLEQDLHPQRFGATVYGRRAVARNIGPQSRPKCDLSGPGAPGSLHRRRRAGTSLFSGSAGGRRQPLGGRALPDRRH